MSYSCILFHGSPLPLSLKSKAEINRKSTTKIVCCCPFFGSDTDTGGQARKQCEPSLFGFLPFLSKVESPEGRLPPGPSFLHLMGMMHYAVRSFPYHHPLRELANAYGPLVHVKLGEVSTIVVSSAEIAKEVLKTHESAFLNRPKSVGTQIISYNYTDIVLSPYSGYYKQMRNVCVSKFLNPKIMTSMEHMRKDEASVAIESIQSKGLLPINLSDEISLFMSSMACRAVLRDVCLDRRNTIVAIKHGASVGASFALADVFPSIKVLELFSLNKYRMMKLKKQVDKTMDNIIGDHKSNEELDTQNFLDSLLRFKDSEEDRLSITDENIKSIAAISFLHPS